MNDWLSSLAHPRWRYHSARVPPLFVCEAFAQQPIHHQLGVNLKLGWCGRHDCDGLPSMLARNPPENCSRVWWIAEVAADRSAVRHDLFPKQSELLEGPDQRVLWAQEARNWIKGHCT